MSAAMKQRERPDVVDLRRHRDARERDARARKPVPPRRRFEMNSATAWLIILAAAAAWALVRWLGA
jgi:hypothetical protein